MDQVGVEVEESRVPADPARVQVQLDDTRFVGFVVAGSAISGEFRCLECRYGAVVQRILPHCPMCGGVVWESRGPLEARRLAD